VRHILEEGGLRDVNIFASGGLDEDAIDAMLRAGAPIDGFGVGTNLTTSADVPAIDCVTSCRIRRPAPPQRQSVGKATWPGRKQVCAATTRWPHGGRRALAPRATASREPLLVPVMRNGKPLEPRLTLAMRARGRAASSTAARFPVQPVPGGPYPVEIADALSKMAAEVDRRLALRMSEKNHRAATFCSSSTCRTDFLSGRPPRRAARRRGRAADQRLARNSRTSCSPRTGIRRPFVLPPRRIRSKAFDTIACPTARNPVADHCVQARPARNSAMTCASPRPSLSCARVPPRHRLLFRLLRERHTTPTASRLSARAGLAASSSPASPSNFCVRYSAEDAHRDGFEVVVIEDALSRDRRGRIGGGDACGAREVGHPAGGER